MDFVRFLHPQLLGLFGFMILVLIVSTLVKKTGATDVNLVNKVRNWLLVVALAGVAWFAFSAATINETPRKVIDRSVINERADTLKDDTSKAVENFKKKEDK